jgi:rRNA-processing protein FCF1
VEKIILDTNFLLAVLDLKIDIFEEISKACDFNYQLYILDATEVELEKLINGPSLSKRKAAQFAQKLLKGHSVTVIATKGGHVDDLLVSMKGYIIATVDKGLKQRLQQKQVKVLTIRQKKYMVFV